MRTENLAPTGLVKPAGISFPSALRGAGAEEEGEAAPRWTSTEQLLRVHSALIVCCNP